MSVPSATIERPPTHRPASDRVGGILFRLAELGDDAALRELLRQTPIPGSVTITMEREPSFFYGAGIEGDVHQTLVVMDEEAGALAGVGSRSVYDAYLDGARGRLGYLSQLRAAAPYMGRPRLMLRGFRFMERLHAGEPVPLYVTTLIDGNERARRILEKDLPGKPTYRRRDVLRTFAIPLWRRRPPAPPPGCRVRAASASDLPDIADCLQRNYARLQLAPVWTADDLTGGTRTRGLAPEDFFVAERGGRIVGCMARWDETPFKQNVIRSYSGVLGWSRPLLNIAAAVTGAPRLPAVGEPLRGVFLSHVAVDGEETGVFMALLGTALAAGPHGGHAFATVGFCASHPFATVVADAFRSIEYRAHVYIVHWPDGAARADALGNGVTHVEAATL